MKPIAVSFKQNERWLYDYILGKSSSPSIYLKDLAIADFKKNQKDQTGGSTVQNVPKFDFLD